MDKQDLRDKRAITQARVKKLLDKPLTGQLEIAVFINGKIQRKNAYLTRPGYTHCIDIPAGLFIDANMRYGDLVGLEIKQPSTKGL